MGRKIWVSDVITGDDVKDWQPGDVITIQANTGDGKSYFIKNGLYEYAKANGKKILFLIHRDNTLNQFRYEVQEAGKDDTIYFRTYQSIEHSLIYGGDAGLSGYHYIVVDEAHYFVSDSTFNNRTDLSFEAIMRQNDAVRIFMSATPGSIQLYVNQVCGVKAKDYRVNSGYSNIQSLTFFSNDDMLDEFAKQFLDRNEKAIFFIKRAQDAYHLYLRFQGVATFNCSKANRLHKYVNGDAINRLLETESFDTPLLITTSCLDSGANIVDKCVKNIVVDMIDIDTIIQCVGRKRSISDDDKIRLYIKSISNQQIGGYETTFRRHLQMADYLSSHTAEELLRKFPRQDDTGGIIFDTFENGHIEKKINRLRYFKKKQDIELFHAMKGLGEFCFSKHLARHFGFFDNAGSKYQYDVVGADHGINSYIERMVGKDMLGRSDRKEFLDRLNVRQGGHKLKSAGSINAALQERNIPYRIREFSTSRVVNGKKKNYKSAWRVERMVADETNG